jgi:hypothetical protein
MLSTIKTSLCSVLLLATYATAASQSAINLEVKYCSKENTGSSNDQGTYRKTFVLAISTMLM